MTDKPRVYSVYADDPLYIALVKERDELRAEVERVKANHVTVTEEAQRRHDAVATLGAEIVRLRAVLQRLVDCGPSTTLKQWRDAQAAGAEALGRENC